ncbi:uncharacterized protein EI90DRAFT_3114992 [Cantharellus anzutake]|uniref:uncharacterized protein n=1 Tax=Cantharellus anzutake TaxID=1750568 RepID=UPI001903917D|nr:uncharacterized protein EI90DRAFT_3114992 [Cantharellus anzutake]KAF8344247.1 hypothetical protein EI90DRAFT_3114992 [Cantharellus anzutake]
MSFVTRFTARQSSIVARNALVASHFAPLSTTAVRSKTVAETTKDTLDTVNKKVGKGLASAIEGTETVVKKTKEVLINPNQHSGGKTDQAKAKAQEAAGQASQKVNQTTAEAQQKKEELLGKGKSH